MEYDFDRRGTSLLVVLAVILCASVALGQGIVTGSISGTVIDPAGAVVSGAKVTAKHLATNREFTGESSSSGGFNLRQLPPGAYDFKIEAPHYRAYESRGVGVNVGTDTALGTVKLEIGAATETITVEGAAPLVESTTQQISETFSALKMQSLPMNNNLDDVALFVPGVASAGDAGFSNNNGAEFAVNGQRARSNNFQIDGQSNNDNSIGGPMVFFGNQDAISEVQVVTHYSAEYGRNMGAVVNYVTKAGTNQFHGTAFELWQGNTFSSMNNEDKSPLFGFCDPHNPAPGCTHPVVPQFVDNRFGGTVGGPIVKDRIWFFGSTNLERIRTQGTPSSSGGGILPDATGVQQLITAFPNSPAGPLLAAIGPAAVKVGNPTFSNIQNVLVTNQIDPSTGSAFTCTTAGVNGCVPIEMGSFSRFVPSPFNDYEATGRVDFKLTDKDNFFVRYVFQQQINNGVNFGLGTDVGDWQQIPGRNQQIGLDWSRSLSNNFLNQARFSYSREKSLFNEGSYPGCNYGAPTNCPPEMLLLGSAPQDSVSFGVASGFPQGRFVNVYQLQDNASIQKNTHTLKFGGEFSVQRSPNLFLPNNNGVYLIGSFSDLVANNPAQTRITVGNPHLPFHEKDLSFYFQDDWRIKQNLTLNLGLRWEWFQQAINLLHDETVARQKGPNPFWDTTLPLSLTTVPHIPEALHNFGPVIGFAWTPRMFKSVFGEDRTVIRGGFRIGYDPEFYNMFLNTATSAPVVNAARFSDPNTIPTTGPYTGTALTTFLAPFTPIGINPGTKTQVHVAPNFHNPYSEQWNLGIQRSFTSRIAAEVRYVGNHGVGNFQNVNGNPAIGPLAAAFPQLIPAGITPCTTAGQPGASLGYANCNFRNVTERGNWAWSKYHGLQNELRIGQWHGLTTTVSYTYSHTIDNASEVYSNTGGGSTVSFAQNPFNTDRAEEGNSGIDFRHVVGIAFIYDLPFYKTQKGLLGHVLGGWQFNSTYRYSTGQTYTVVQKHASDFCDASRSMSATYDACRPILSNASLPMNSVGQYCDGTTNCVGADLTTPLALGTLVNFTDPCLGSVAAGSPCAVTPISGAHWIHNDNAAALFLGSPFLGAPRNFLRGQPVSTANMSMFKNFKLTERFTMQFQATAFNVMNVQYRGVPSPVLDNVAIGAFGNTNFNFSGGGNNFDIGSGGASTANQVYDGINRRRLMFGLKMIF